MVEELLEAEAIEEDVPAGAEPRRPLPAPAPSAEVSPWRDEVKTAALAAAGGLVAGAATVVAVRATRSLPARRGARAKQRPANVIASRSFVVDVHVLGR